MKSNRLINIIILSGAMLLPSAAIAQTANPSAGSNATTTRPDRGERFAQELNLTPDQQSQLKTIRENAHQQFEAIRNDSSLTADQKRARMKELRKSTHEQMMAHLTPEQQKQFKQIHKEHRGHRDGHRGWGKHKQG